MKILVCISCVPDTTSKINFTEENKEFSKDGVQYVINPNDEFGLTRAMWIKEMDGSSIDIINVGTQSNEPILRKALAIGADRAFRVDEDPKDSFRVAKLISNHILKNDYDLIIAGRESIDYNGCMVPGLIGELTNIDFVTNCVKLEINNSRATASREIEGGIEKVSCELPLIIGSQKGLVEESDLKIPNMRGIMQARQKPLEVIEPESFSSQTTTLKYSKPEEKGKIRMINPENLDELVEILHTEEKII